MYRSVCYDSPEEKTLNKLTLQVEQNKKYFASLPYYFLDKNNTILKVICCDAINKINLLIASYEIIKVHFSSMSNITLEK